MTGGRTAAVTGATGFLGTHLCRRLVADGWDVRAMSRPSSDRGELADLEEIEWYVGDLFETDTLRELVDGADVVFHLAGIGLWSAGPDTVYRVNVEGTENVLEACRDGDVGRLVFTSTSGTRRVDGTAAADESDVATPVGAYQASKADAEQLVDEYADTDGEAVTVHPTSIFGPGDEAFTVQLLSMGLERTMPAYLPGGLSIVGVSDVVDGILLAAEKGENGEHYILGGENLTYRQAVSRISHALDGSPARIQVPALAIHAAGPVAEAASAVAGVRMFPFDRQMAQLATERMFYTSAKAQAELGYEYRPIEDHLPETVEWYREEA
ncbi:NAD-dependent epimerase/dehydratase family protein [Natronolimnohabitans innermongolicus]|uniref:NAD-dependent epimerase/dehydratase n=1 Tax=Natronolimnohabitans innermongolicus JCM 12255 TaxID=1227499 RepID=L9WKQ9_9EURY|nr:NAD-dependent epimerase/dehydratase family protein [Natronolimnohabitans innermongolicus]ELY48943.1 NAD-dependent epimerase/dehydratase [Natronolimnohabitans innermongolicus JCM 12255]